MFQIQLFVEGEDTFVKVPRGCTVAQIREFAHCLEGKNPAGYRVNGCQAKPDQQLQEGDRVTATPEAGVLG